MLRIVLFLTLLAAPFAGAEDRYIRDLRKGAKKGDAVAQYKLGMAYADAYKVKRDYATAVEWLLLAGDQGHPQALEFVAKLYFTGHGVEQDHQQAAALFEKSARLGNPEAQVLLGGMFVNGEGVDQDFKKAAYWYRLAADQGYARGQYNLGVLHNNGEGVQQDLVRAYKWIYLAAHDPPEEYASEYTWVRDDLARALPETMVQEAVQQASTFQPRPWRELKAALGE